MKYKMFVSDLDGTMFDWSLKLNEKNQEMIAKAIEKDIVVVIATGRPCYSAVSIAASLGISEDTKFVICFNGGAVAKAGTGEIIYEMKLNDDDAHYIINQAKLFKGDIVAYINRMPYSFLHTDEVSEYAVSTAGTITYDKDFNKKFLSGYNKILIKGEHKYLEELRISLSDWIKDRVSCFYSSEKLLEFINIDVSKGQAMLELAKKFGINREEIVAIGDYYNDISMIKAAGLGVAIKGAPDDVIAVADYVTERSAPDGAVAEVIEKFIL